MKIAPSLAPHENVSSPSPPNADLLFKEAKLSVIAEYVWLLGHVQNASRRFLVFGQDRAVPLRWLKRFAPLLYGIEFWFLEGSELERLA
ncbi:MAG TPA: hypothetical protein VEG62_04705 [Acidimicrobiales bacterium]|nr:hypothetical protein [Acidimicrobiales bacterium]